MRDVFNMTRFHIPSNLSSASKKQLSDYIGIHFPERVREKELQSEEGTQYCIDLEFYNQDLSEKEKKKQEFYENLYDYTVPSNGGSWVVKNNQSGAPSINDVPNILDNLTPEDARHLIETEDEISQSKGYASLVLVCSSLFIFNICLFILGSLGYFRRVVLKTISVSWKTFVIITCC